MADTWGTLRADRSSAQASISQSWRSPARLSARRAAADPVVVRRSRGRSVRRPLHAELMTLGFGAIAAAFALVGTAIQAFSSLKQLREADPEGQRAFVAVDGLSTEFRASRHPLRWWRRRNEMRELLLESPEEARLYRRVQMQIWAWVLLMVAAGFALTAETLGV